jgi:hypothetical protein
MVFRPAAAQKHLIIGFDQFNAASPGQPDHFFPNVVRTPWRHQELVRTPESRPQSLQNRVAAPDPTAVVGSQPRMFCRSHTIRESNRIA